MNKNERQKIYELISICSKFLKNNNPEQDAIKYLYNKIYKDYVCIFELLEKEDYFLEQANVLLRSALEAVILYCNLLCDENLCDEYLSLAQLFEFADMIIFYSGLLEMSPEQIIRITNKTREEFTDLAKEEICASFEGLNESNKKVILKETGQKEFDFDMNKLKKFCRYYAPFLSRLGDMLSKLDEYKIYGEHSSVNIKKFIYEYYSRLSHRTHNCYPYFKTSDGRTVKKGLEIKEIFHLISFLNQLCVLAMKLNKNLKALPADVIEVFSKYTCCYYGVDDISQI